MAPLPTVMLVRSLTELWGEGGDEGRALLQLLNVSTWV